MVYSFELKACVTGYHIYQDVLKAAEGEVLLCSREDDNASAPHAVAVMSDSKVVGHIPRLVSAACHLFLVKGGSIS